MTNKVRTPSSSELKFSQYCEQKMLRPLEILKKWTMNLMCCPQGITASVFQNWKSQIGPDGEIVVGIDIIKNYTFEQKSSDGQAGPFLGKVISIATE